MAKYNYIGIIKRLQYLLDNDPNLSDLEREAFDYIIDGMEQYKRFHWIRDEIVEYTGLDLDALLLKHQALLLE